MDAERHEIPPLIPGGPTGRRRERAGPISRVPLRATGPGAHIAALELLGNARARANVVRAR